MLDGAHAALAVHDRELQDVVAGLDEERAVVDEGARAGAVPGEECRALHARIEHAALPVEERERQRALLGHLMVPADLRGDEQPDLRGPGVLEVVGRHPHRHVAADERAAERLGERLAVGRPRRRLGGDTELAARAHGHAIAVHLDLDLVGLAVVVVAGRLEREQVVARDLARDPLEHALAAARDVEHGALGEARQRLESLDLQALVEAAGGPSPGFRRVEGAAREPQRVQRHLRSGREVADPGKIGHRLFRRQAFGDEHDRLGARDRPELAEHGLDAGDRRARPQADVGHDGLRLELDGVGTHRVVGAGALSRDDRLQGLAIAAHDVHRLALADPVAVAVEGRRLSVGPPKALAHAIEVVGERHPRTRRGHAEHRHPIGGRQRLEKPFGGAERRPAAPHADVALIDDERDQPAHAGRLVAADERRGLGFGRRRGVGRDSLLRDELERCDGAGPAVHADAEVGGGEARQRTAVLVHDGHQAPLDPRLEAWRRLLLPLRRRRLAAGRRRGEKRGHERRQRRDGKGSRRHWPLAR